MKTRANSIEIKLTEQEIHDLLLICGAMARGGKMMESFHMNIDNVKSAINMVERLQKEVMDNNLLQDSKWTYLEEYLE